MDSKKYIEKVGFDSQNDLAVWGTLDKIKQNLDYEKAKNLKLKKINTLGTAVILILGGLVVFPFAKNKV
jgi:hypothetical protein